MDVQRKLDEAETPARRRCAGAPRRERPDVEARLVQLYKLGRAGYWRLLLDVDDLQRARPRLSHRGGADATSIASASGEHYADARRAGARAQGAAGATRGDRQARRREAHRARAAADQAVAGRTALVASIDARRDLNAQLTGELKAAQQTLQASLAQIDARHAGVATPCRCGRSRARCPGRSRGRVLGRFGRQPSSRSAPPSSATASRSRLPKDSRSGPSTRARSRSPTSSPATATWSSSTTATGPTRSTAISARWQRRRRATASRPQAPVGTVGPEPRRQPGAVLRVARRRQAGRSLTMAEEAS